MFKSFWPKVLPLAVIIAVVCFSSTLRAQVPTSTPQKSPVPAATPAATPPAASTPTRPTILSGQITLDEALRLATTQLSSVQNAALTERMAAQDVKQAQAAFLPKVSAPLSYIYTSPALGLPPGEPRAPSFIAADAISAYEGLVNVAGDFDVAGKLRASLNKNRALLAAAQAGTEVTRRALAQAVIESYYGLALAIAQQQAAQGNLAAATEFEQITALLLSGGEVAPVDLTRAQLQTLTRRDELERAKVNEEIAASGLRVLVGYEVTKPISTSDLSLTVANVSDYQNFKVEDIARRPELTQLQQEFRAAKEEVKIARADRLPSLSYSLNGGFDSDSLKAPRLKEHTGVSAAITLNIPIFDWGATRSRERQAKLRAEAAENEQILARRGFTQQFFAARAQAASAAERMRVAREGVTKAQDNVNASVARYRAGEAQIVEVTDAQTTLVEQRTNLYQAFFDYQIALAKLRQATGQ